MLHSVVGKGRTGQFRYFVLDQLVVLNIQKCLKMEEKWFCVFEYKTVLQSVVGNRGSKSEQGQCV